MTIGIRCIVASGFLLLVFGLMACASVQGGAVVGLKDRLENPKPNDVMVAAHRACWRYAPENSLKAIEECIRMGADMVELDVRMSSDGELVVIHDTTVDRTTDGSGKVSDLTLSELRSLRLRQFEGGVDKPLTEQKIPTLEEALLAAKGKILVNLDIVLDHVFEPALEVAAETGTLQQILIKMPLDSPEDEKFKRSGFLKDVYFMPIFREKERPLSETVHSFDDIDPVAYEIVFTTTGYLAEGADSIAGQGERFWVNTMWERLAPGHSDDVAILNPDAHWGYLIDLGVNMIQTDRPGALLSYLEANGLRP